MKTLTFFTCTGLAIAGFALAKSEPAGHIQSLSHAIHAVNDLDTTLAFYNDVFGLPGKAQDFPNPAVPLLTNAPGVTLRLSMLALPGKMRFELTHFKGLERKPAQAKYTDPGAASIVFHVRDIDAVVANAKKANAPVLTTGGAPVEISTAAGKARSIIIRDPDGFFVQSIQDAPEAGAPEGNVHRVSLAYTMESAESHGEVLYRHDGRRTFRAVRIFEGSGSPEVVRRTCRCGVPQDLRRAPGASRLSGVYGIPGRTAFEVSFARSRSGRSRNGDPGRQPGRDG